MKPIELTPIEAKAIGKALLICGRSCFSPSEKMAANSAFSKIKPLVKPERKK